MSSLRPAGRTMACRRERLRWAGSTPAMASAFLPCRSGSNPGLVYDASTYALTFTADDGLLKSSKTVTVTVGEAAGKAPADFCRYHGEVYGVAEGRLTVMKSDKDALAVGEDGFLGPFANEGDKVSWQVQAPWSGQFLLNVTFNGKWGGKQNSFVVNGALRRPWPSADG